MSVTTNWCLRHNIAIREQPDGGWRCSLCDLEDKPAPAIQRGDATGEPCRACGGRTKHLNGCTREPREDGPTDGQAVATAKAWVQMRRDDPQAVGVGINSEGMKIMEALLRVNRAAAREAERLRKEVALRKRIIDRLPLCPDHRDKVRETCCWFEVERLRKECDKAEIAASNLDARLDAAEGCLREIEKYPNETGGAIAAGYFAIGGEDGA